MAPFFVDKEKFEYMVIGSKILGTGGGGEEKIAKEIGQKIFEMKERIKVVPIEEANKTDFYTLIGSIGGIPEKETSLDIQEINELDTYSETIKLMEEYLLMTQGHSLQGFYPSEIGPENLAIPFYAAALTNKFVLDADTAGRAKPELTISSTAILDIPVCPLTAVSKFGDHIIVKKVRDYSRAEKILRALAVSSGGEITSCRTPLRGDKLIHQKTGQYVLIPNGVQQSIFLGEQIVKARKNRQSVEKIITKATNSDIIYRGKLKRVIIQKKSGFITGKLVFQGINDWDKKLGEVYFKNEFMYLVIDGKTVVTPPDHIYVFDSLTGDGLNMWDDLSTRKDRVFSVSKKKAANIWYSEKGKKIFGPNKFLDLINEYKES